MSQKVAEGFVIEVHDPALISRIAEHTFDELPKQIQHVDFLTEYIRVDGNLIEPLDYVFLKRQARQGFEISVAIRPPFGEWMGAPIIKAEFMVEFHKRLRGHYATINSDDLDFEISFLVKDTDATIQTELFNHRDKLQSIYDQTVAFLNNQRESVAVFFDFPESIRVPCEQYLLYFAQFLKDLGVEADTALTHEAGQVLSSLSLPPIGRKP